jgi:transcription elongation factor GreA
VAEQLADVHEDTDWGEEATFFDAMVEKERLDERIGHLRYVLEHAEIINGDNDPDLVDPGDRVTVWDLNNKEEVVYDLIGSEEVAHGRHGVSIKSPVGQALIGHRIGDVVEVEIPDGIARYTIRKIVPLAEAKA